MGSSGDVVDGGDVRVPGHSGAHAPSRAGRESKCARRSPAEEIKRYRPPIAERRAVK